MASILDRYGWHEWLTKSNFSFLVGASHPDEILKEAIKHSYSSLCINDFDGLYGAARFHRHLMNLSKASGALCVSDGLSAPAELSPPHSPRPPLKMHYGAEIHFEMDHDKPILLQNTLCLVAHNWEGYRNLCQILTRTHQESKTKAFISLEELTSFDAKGLSAIQPMRGLIRQLGASEQTKLSHFSTLKEHFSNRLYFALSKLHHSAEDVWLKESLAWQRRLESPHIFSQDVFFHTSVKKSLGDLLQAIRSNLTLPEASAYFFPNSERHLHSLKALEKRYSQLPDFEKGMATSSELSQSCNFSLSELSYEYPKEMIPNTHTPQSFLEELTWKGIQNRLGGPAPEALKAKIEHELELIKELRFADYFLTVWDIVRWARAQEILCQGRGSAANSIVCWALEVTSVHPEQFDLLVERFISKERGDPPDIDIDFEHERREEVLQYIYNRYGRAKAAMVANVICFRRKGALRAVGKAFGLSETQLQEVTQASKSRYLRGQNSGDLIHAIRSKVEQNRAGLPKHFSWELWHQMADQLVGFPRHLGIHSGGFVISQHHLNELVPQEPATMEGRTVIQWSKEDLEGLGFFKIDLLSLGMLTAIRKCFESIKTHYGQELSLYSLPVDDPGTYQMIQRADTVGVFQIESRAQMSMLPRLKPKEFYDLVIEVAIIRPGPIQGGVIHPYLKRRKGLEPVRCPELLEPVLRKTLGIAIFQEQAMRVAMLAGDFTPGEANELRRHIGTWNAKDFSRDLDPWLGKLERGMKAKGLDAEFIHQIIEHMKGFAHYGFPESHAVSFALLAYASSYLKCHYPAAFFMSVMNSQPMGFYSVAALSEAAKRDGVMVLPICINHSDWDHKLEEFKENSFALRLGFRVVHSLQKEAALEMTKARASIGGRFKDLAHLLQATQKLFRSDLTALAAAGAFSSFGLSRSEALWATEACPLRPLIDEEESAVMWKQESLLQRLQRDFKATGLSLGPHPTLLFRKEFWKYQENPRLFSKAEDLATKRNGLTVHCFGMLIIRQAPPSARGMVFVTLEDETGFINLAFTPQVYERYYQHVDFTSFLCIKGRVQKADSYHSILVQEVFAENKEARPLHQISYEGQPDDDVSKVAAPNRSYY